MNKSERSRDIWHARQLGNRSIIGGWTGAYCSVSISEEILLPHLQPSHPGLFGNGGSINPPGNRSDLKCSWMMIRLFDFGRFVWIFLAGRFPPFGRVKHGGKRRQRVQRRRKASFRIVSSDVQSMKRAMQATGDGHDSSY